MSIVFAMQRANGDWFALDNNGKTRVPLFSDQREAMQARAFNTELLVFKPVLLNQCRVGTLAPGRGESVDFQLIEKEATGMNRGRVMNHEELVLLVGNSDE